MAAVLRAADCRAGVGREMNPRVAIEPEKCRDRRGRGEFEEVEGGPECQRSSSRSVC